MIKLNGLIKQFHRVWRDIIFNKMINVKCLCVLKKKQKENIWERDAWEFEDDPELKRTNINDVFNANNINKNCLILDEKSCNE